MLDGIVINDNSLVIFIRLNSEESCINKDLQIKTKLGRAKITKCLAAMSGSMLGRLFINCNPLLTL